MANRGHVARNAGRRLVVADQDRLDPMLLVGRQALGIGFDRHALAPFGIDGIDLEPEATAHLDPKMGELAEARGQHPVAGGKRVGQRRFPAAGARAWKDENLAGLGLEDLLQVAEQAEGELGEVRGPLVLERNVHGGAHLLGHVRRPGDEQGVAS